MRKLLFIVFVAVLASACQPKITDPDHLTFKNAKWEVTSIADGVTLKQYHFQGQEQIFESSQYVSIIEIDTRKVKGGRWALANDPGKITQTSKFAADSGALVAMNGTFYNMRPPYNSVSFFRKYGELCYEKNRHSRSALALANKFFPPSRVKCFRCGELLVQCGGYLLPVAVAITSLTLSSSAPSATTVTTVTPYFSSRVFFALSSLASSLPVMTRFDPSLANAVAIPNPNPLPPPVIIVTLFSSLFKIFAI